MDIVLFTLMNTAQVLVVLVGLAKFCKIKFGILNLNFDGSQAFTLASLTIR